MMWNIILLIGLVLAGTAIGSQRELAEAGPRPPRVT